MGHLTSTWRNVYHYSGRSVVERFARVERSEDHEKKECVDPNIINNIPISI